VKLPLVVKPRREDSKHYTLYWKSCAPFVENSRGVLIHRPRSVMTVTLHKTPHIAIGHWCGMGTTGGKEFTFLIAPPENAILCEKCELAAGRHRSFTSLPCWLEGRVVAFF